jgi:hypothetical protein
MALRLRVRIPETIIVAIAISLFVLLKRYSLGCMLFATQLIYRHPEIDHNTQNIKTVAIHNHEFDLCLRRITRILYVTVR